MSVFRWMLGVVAFVGMAVAADQSKVGEGNARAVEIASKSPRVRQAYEYLRSQARRIQNPVNLIDGIFCRSMTLF